MTRAHVHFVTGRLAERSLRRVVAALAEEAGFNYTIDVLPITVAALMTPAWIAKHIAVPAAATRVLLPGYCDGDLTTLQGSVAQPVERGPRDLRQLPSYFSQPTTSAEVGDYDIEIIAEINECPRRSREEILAVAADLASDGADVIDVGCLPGDVWTGVGDIVHALGDAGHRVSVDSLNPAEISQAVKSGAELVLSVNSTNREHATDWGVEVVVTPDLAPMSNPDSTLRGLDETVEKLADAGVPLRIDPILEPIAFGFAESLGRYLEVRRRYPDAEMMMGVGNLTELTDVDSAGVNVMLLGFCQELGIRSLLTTQVINWARTSVRECDLARRLVHHAVHKRVLPKHVEPRLVMLRDTEVLQPTPETMQQLADQIRDNDYRVFSADGEVHLVGRELYLHHADPFVVMDQLLADDSRKLLDPSHAFYLGYELCKALTALTLGKSYEQDEPLDWGLATRGESSRYLRRARRSEEPS